MTPPLRVAVDATAIPPRLTGAGVYAAKLLASFARRDDLDLEVFAALGSFAALAAPGLRLRAVRAAGLGRPARIGWTQLAAGLLRLAGDQELRARLAAAGPPRAARFTWPATAAATWAAYLEALA